MTTDLILTERISAINIDANNQYTPETNLQYIYQKFLPTRYRVEIQVSADKKTWYFTVPYKEIGMSV